MRALTIALALLVSLSAFAESPVYVLDAGSKSILRVDAQRGAVEAKAPLPFTDEPAELAFAPGGKRLVVLSRGKGRDSNASAAIVDAATLTASPRIDLGRGVADVVFTRDGKSAIVLSPGSGDVPAALFRIDLATATVSKRLDLDRVADQFGAVSDDLGVLFQKGGKLGNARVSFVSLGSLEPAGTLDLTGKAAELVSIPGSGYLYAVESSAVDVVSIAERKLAGTVTVGNNAKLGGIDETTGSLFVMATNDQKNGFLYVLRGASLIGTSGTGAGAPEIFRLTADRKRALVGNSRGVTAVDLTPAISSRPPAQLYSGFVASNMTVFDAAATADGRRVFLLMRSGDKCCTMAVADPELASKVAIVQVGRTSRRVAQGLLALVATAASFSAGRADAKMHGRGFFTYSLYGPAAAGALHGAFAFGPDGKALYVLDSGTDTVTVVDVDSGKRIADLDAPGDVNSIMLLGGKTIVAAGGKGIALIDSATNAAGEKIDLRSDLHALVVSPDGATALALSKGDLAVIDGRTSKVAAHVAGLVNPVAAVFAEH